MVEVSGELLFEMGSVHSELQYLGPLKKSGGTLLDKMEILERVDWILQRTEESGPPSWDQVNAVAHETMIQ